MKLDETTVVDTENIVSEDARSTLLSICEDLKERGYHPEKQIVAYLISGDPGYISNYKECRNRLTKYKKEDLLEIMLVNFINK
jgi:uncharacterized protein (UPF0297 family)